MSIRLAPVLCALLLFGCGGETVPSGDQPAAKSSAKPDAAPTAKPDATPAATSVISTPEVHDAICGHVLEEVGHCGNYVKIDGKYVVLQWPELGKMEYCSKGKAGAKVEITGEMKDGKFVAATYRQVE